MVEIMEAAVVSTEEPINSDQIGACLDEQVQFTREKYLEPGVAAMMNKLMTEHQRLEDTKADYQNDTNVALENSMKEKQDETAEIESRIAALELATKEIENESTVLSASLDTLLREQVKEHTRTTDAIDKLVEKANEKEKPKDGNEYQWLFEQFRKNL